MLLLTYELSLNGCGVVAIIETGPSVYISCLLYCSSPTYTPLGVNYILSKGVEKGILALPPETIRVSSSRDIQDPQNSH